MSTDQTDDDQGTLELVGALADRWRAARAERQERTHLEMSDFDAIRATGFLQAVVPEAMGGTWRGASTSIRSICSMLRLLGAADPSVALVSSMHPAVLAFWLTITAADDEPGWHQQRQAVLATALAGQRWGTLSSEPGTGGDMLRTRAVAASIGGSGALPGQRYALSGDKHFGSGMGITDWMITTAVPAGETEPAMFVLDVHDRTWDGSSGIRLVSEWDGVGMAATQSHGFRLDDVPAIRLGTDRPLAELASAASPFILTLFVAVIMGVLDEVMSTARQRLGDRIDELRPHARVGWAGADRQHWLAAQAFEGAIAAVESGDDAAAQRAAIRAKVSVSELAESVLTSVGQVLGGSTLSAGSPFSHWSADVRALGFLRPPWSLADDQLFETSW